jgi:transcriptional regulator with XRE-family HTH domain
MLMRHALGEVLRELRTEKGWTLRATAKKSCMALGYLSEVERGHKEVSSEILDTLTHTLGFQTHEVIILAGYRLGGLDRVPNTASELLDEYADLVAR